MKLKLEINPRATRIAPVSGGVDFVGFIIRPEYMLVRRRVIGNLKAKLKIFREQLVEQQGETTRYHFDSRVLNNCLATVNSYLGHFKHAQTRQIVQRIFADFPFLKTYFQISSSKLTRGDKSLRKAKSLKDQVFWLNRNYENYICLIQIGVYYEAFNRHAKALTAITGIKLRENWRGFCYGCGFPKWVLGKVMETLEEKRLPYIIVYQTGRELYKAKERLPFLKVEFVKN